MNTNKIVLPTEVAEALEYYTAVCDCKTDALMDIIRMGYEGKRSELILRHFDHDIDELMQALICGYEVEKSPEDLVREYYEKAINRIGANALNGKIAEAFGEGQMQAIHFVLNTFGIDVDGIPYGYKHGGDTE